MDSPQTITLDDDSARNLIYYRKFKELHTKIGYLKELTELSGEPQCMSLEGEPGVGKSTLAKTYQNMYPPKNTSDGKIIPVFYMETPSPATVKGFASKILTTLGDPLAAKGTLWSMDTRIFKLAKECQVEFFIFDDFHQLIEPMTNKVIASVSDWLKVMIKETKKPVLVVGVTGQVEIILRANSQLSRLFACREKLEPFKWDINDEEAIKDFSFFVNCAEQSLKTTLSTEITRLDMINRIHYATNGVVANVMNLLRYSLIWCKNNKRDHITLDALSFAFVDRVGKHLYSKTNPFTSNKWSLPENHVLTPTPTPANISTVLTTK
jgi:hypothetical protein